MVDRDGQRTRRFAHLGPYGLVTTPDHSIVGFLDDDGALQVLENAGRRRLALPAVAQADSPGALLGSGTCREEFPEGGGCTAFLNTPHDDRAWLTTSHGIVDRVPGLLSVTDASQQGRLIGLTSRQPRRCSSLLSARGRVAWQTCRFELTAFSPDGELSYGTLGREVGVDVHGLAIFDRSGHRLAEWSRKRTGYRHQVADVTWEDSRHLLVVVYARGAWSVVRLGADGSREYAVAPRSMEPDFSPFRLPLS